MRSYNLKLVSTTNLCFNKNWSTS